MPSQNKVVVYHSKDRPNVIVTDGNLYAEITPNKGVIPTATNIPFEQFLGYYTEEEFNERTSREESFQ